MCGGAPLELERRRTNEEQSGPTPHDEHARDLREEIGEQRRVRLVAVPKREVGTDRVEDGGA